MLHKIFWLCISSEEYTLGEIWRLIHLVKIYPWKNSTDSFSKFEWCWKKKSWWKISSSLKLVSVSYYQEFTIDFTYARGKYWFSWFMPFMFEVEAYYGATIECEWAWLKKLDVQLAVFTRKPLHNDLFFPGVFVITIYHAAP